MTSKIKNNLIKEIMALSDGDVKRRFNDRRQEILLPVVRVQK